MLHAGSFRSLVAKPMGKNATIARATNDGVATAKIQRLAGKFPPEHSEAPLSMLARLVRRTYWRTRSKHLQVCVVFGKRPTNLSRDMDNHMD